MIFKGPERYRSVRRLERRLARLAAAAAAGVGRQDERQDAYIALHAATEAVRARLREQVATWQRERWFNLVTGLCLMVPALIVFTMMIVFVARVRDAWVLFLVEPIGAVLVIGPLAAMHISVQLRPLRREVKALERGARAAGLTLGPAWHAAAPKT